MRGFFIESEDVITSQIKLQQGQGSGDNQQQNHSKQVTPTDAYQQKLSTAQLNTLAEFINKL